MSIDLSVANDYLETIARALLRIADVLEKVEGSGVLDPGREGNSIAWELGNICQAIHEKR